jgi:hypothetical protein
MKASHEITEHSERNVRNITNFRLLPRVSPTIPLYEGFMKGPPDESTPDRQHRADESPTPELVG